MVPILASAYPYTGNGLGGLADCIECFVTHEINGQYELSLRYPVTGLHFDELANGKIVMAKPDDLADPQPFRIYRITKPLNGVVTVYARHLCYDMAGVVVEPFSATSLTEAFTKIPNYCTPSSPITLQTTRTVATGIELKEPRPLWKLLGGQAGSLLDIYGGEWDFDKTDAKLVTSLGTDRGVSIRYGKNLTELEQDGTIEGSYSGVYPFWYDEESNTLVTLTEKVVTVTGSVVTDKNLVLDCSDDFDTQPTEQQLRDRANAYISANSVGNAKTSWKISFVDTEDIEKIMLGDTLHVYYEALDVNATARAVKTEYDVLKDHYKNITVGRVKQNLAAIIVNDQRETDSKIKTAKSFLEQAIDEATYSITHGGGEFREIYDGYTLKEIVSLDDPDITQALSVWRWNNGGFGHSSTGYNGQYTLALLPDGSINAELITTGILNANIIRAGILQDAAGKNSWNLDTGAFTITNGSIHITTASETSDLIQLSWVDGNGNYTYSTMSPGGFTAMNTGDANNRYYSLTKYGIYEYQDVGNHGYPISSMLGATLTLGHGGANVSGDIYLKDASGTTRHHLDGYGRLWQYDANGKQRTYLEYGDISIYNSSEKPTAHIGTYNNQHGYLYLYDGTSNTLRSWYDYTGIKFADSNGNQTSLYPSTGLFNLTGNKTGDTRTFTGQVINLGFISMSDLGITSTSETWDNVIVAFLKYVCVRYTNATSCKFNAMVEVGSRRMFQCFIYSTAETSGGLPRYSMGTALGYNGVPYIYGTNDYVAYARYVYDYVIEEGASGSWSYRKWKSGVYECWMRKTMSIAVSSAWQSSYYGQVAAQTYPVTFNSSPYEQVSVTGGDGWAWVSGGAALPTTTTTGVYYLVRPASTSAQNYTLDYYVRGTVTS